MKKFLFVIISFLFISNCFAQDTVERKNRLSDSVTERFFVLKSNPAIRQGLYRAFYKRRTLMGFGGYTNNVKTGVWNFYSQNGSLIQSFDFDKNVLDFESPADTNEDVHYLLDEKLKIGDKVTRPVRIGGVYYGLLPYINIYKLPFETYDVNTNSFDATIELLISPLGRLADYKIHVVSEQYQYDRTFSLYPRLFSEEDQSFLPATVNGKPVISRIIIKCYVTSDGGLDYY